MPRTQPNITRQQTILLRRGVAARRLIRDGADPYLMLALVVWPSDEFAAEEKLLFAVRQAATAAAA